MRIIRLGGVLLVAAAAAGLAPGADRKLSRTEWYYADALAMPADTTPATAVHGSMGISLEWLVLFNLSDREAEATVTHYFEDAAPLHKKVKMPARSTVSVGGHGELPETEQPKRKIYGVRVKSPVPVIVQATRAEQETGVKRPVMPGRSFLSRLGYPGPLGKKETAWAYADCFIQRNNPNAEEMEWLSILNPNAGKDAKIKITFNYVKDGQSSHQFVLPAERMKTIHLRTLDAAKDALHAGVLVESNVPVIVEQIRRYWFKWHPAPAGTFVVLAHPVGDVPIKLPSAP